MVTSTRRQECYVYVLNTLLYLPTNVFDKYYSNFVELPMIWQNPVKYLMQSKAFVILCHLERVSEILRPLTYLFVIEIRSGTNKEFCYYKIGSVVDKIQFVHLQWMSSVRNYVLLSPIYNIKKSM